jgi:hypothetical protein
MSPGRRKGYLDVEGTAQLCEILAVMAQKLIHQVIVRARQLIDDEAG